MIKEHNDLIEQRVRVANARAASMPKLTELAIGIDSQLRAAFAIWIDHRVLFRSSSCETSMLLESTAPAYFARERITKERAVMLTIGCLTDPAEQGKNKNLSLAAILQSMTAEIYSAYQCEAAEMVFEEGELAIIEFQSVLSRLEDLSENIREWRNKAIAHFDRFVFSPSTASKHPIVSYKRIDACMKCLEDAMNIAHRLLGRGDIVNSEMIQARAADSLVWVLRRAVRYKDLINEGKIPASDLTESRIANPQQ